MDTKQYQTSLLTELGAPCFDDLLPKIDLAVEKLKAVPGIVEIVCEIATKLEMETELAYLVLFSMELWEHTLVLLNGGTSLSPFQKYLKTL